MSGDVIVHISERQPGVGALHPQGVGRQWHFKYHVVHLLEIGEVRQQFVLLRTDGHAMALDACLGEKGHHVVAQSLAVAEALPPHLQGSHGLVAADAELDAYIPCALSEKLVYGSHLLLVGGAALYELPHFRLRLFRQRATVGEKRMYPRSQVIPRQETARGLEIGES